MNLTEIKPLSVGVLCTMELNREIDMHIEIRILKPETECRQLHTRCNLIEFSTDVQMHCVDQIFAVFIWHSYIRIQQYSIQE